MPRRIDLPRKVKDVLQHVRPLPPEAGTPLTHYQKTASDLWTSLEYIKKAFEKPGSNRAAADRHLTRIYGMFLMNFVENFERFLKETAATCVDRLGNYP